MNDCLVIFLCTIIYAVAIVCIVQWMSKNEPLRLFAIPALIWSCEVFILFLVSILHILGLFNIDRHLLNSLSAIVFIQAGIAFILFFLTQDSTK